MNPEFYDKFGYHNSGHLLIGLSMDPLLKAGKPPEVMTDTATAARDVIFYRWHQMIDNLYTMQQTKLEPYKPFGVGQF